MKSLITSIILLVFISMSSAQDWQWQRNDELLNPSGIKTKGMNTPFTGDFDDDGDIDLIVGCKGGVVQYYENIGTPDTAIWLMNEDYFATLELDSLLAPQPSLVDLDGDGVDELYISYLDSEWGDPAGGISRFLNSGTTENPVWEGAEFEIGYELGGKATHQFVDFDNDDDLDLLVSDVANPHYYENIGDFQNYLFQMNNDVFEGIEPWAGYTLSYSLADFDHDNMYELAYSSDVIDGFDEAWIECFKNLGTVENPHWEGYWGFIYNKCVSRLWFDDFDNDSDLDMLIGNHWVPLFYNENISENCQPSFRYAADGQRWGLPYQYFGDNICFVDFDNDSDFDLTYVFMYIVWGQRDEMLDWSSAVNTGSDEFFQLDYMQEFFGFPGWASHRDMFLSAGDLNGDGFPELATNSSVPCYYNNLYGSGFEWNVNSIFEIDNFDYNQYPELADFNGDGLTDLAIRTRGSIEWMFYKNVGNPYYPAWLRMPNWRNNIDIPIFQFRAAKIDHDNRIDLIGIDENQYLHGFINTGSGDDISFIYEPEIFEGWEDYIVRYYDCVDLDGDGDDDILVDSSGVINFIENMTPVDIAETDRNLPNDFALLRNYPNPFNGSTNISFALLKAGMVNLTIYDILGREVAVIADGNANSGIHTVIWDGVNSAGLDAPSGVYFYKLTAMGRSITRKMSYLK